jgi:hypothetical protein
MFLFITVWSIPSCTFVALGESVLKIPKQKRARDDEGALNAHHRNGLRVGVIIGAGEGLSKHAAIIQQEIYCDKSNEKFHGPFTV